MRQQCSYSTGPHINGQFDWLRFNLARDFIVRAKAMSDPSNSTYYEAKCIELRHFSNNHSRLTLQLILRCLMENKTHKHHYRCLHSLYTFAARCRSHRPIIDVGPLGCVIKLYTSMHAILRTNDDGPRLNAIQRVWPFHFRSNISVVICAQISNSSLMHLEFFRRVL